MIRQAMRRLTIATLACLCLPAPAQVSHATPARFALVELFTSEGCSSCPPADNLLARLSADAARSGEPVAALSFHVTYWNRLGWTDRFSDEAFTKRQGAYAKQLALQSLYTPQMVVDGEHEFVGSDEESVKGAVRTALSRSRSTRLTLKARPDRGGITASCDVAGAPEGSVLWVAWADAEESSSPDRGENEGRQLHHVNVVRALERTPIRIGASTSAVHLRRPADVAGSVVAWVQRGDVGPVLAGAVTPVAAGSGQSP
jgi:hypothetical protein